MSGAIDNADVTAPDELPHWHIESKGTASPKLVCSKVRAWFKQIIADCPEKKFGVVINFANGYAPVALMDFATYKIIAQEVGSMSVAADDSFSPASDLRKMEKGCRIYAHLTNKSQDFQFTGAIAFEPTLGHIIIAIDAILWLSWALKMEESLKAALAAQAAIDAEKATPRLDESTGLVERKLVLLK